MPKRHRTPDGTEVYFDGAHYDADNLSVQEDKSFYLGMAKKAKGPVLELACGTGRLTIPLAEAGADITGLDYSPAMLARAEEKSRAKNLKLKLIRGDYRNFSLGRKFALIYIPFNSLQHTHKREDLEKIFVCVKKHLSKDGLFIADVFNPSPAYISRDPEKRREIGAYKDPYGGGDLKVGEYYRYDKASQTAYILWEYRKGKREIFSKKLNMRCFFPQELDALFHYNGFKILKKYGSFDKKPFSSASLKQIITAKKA